jgi:hypothetical protein
MSDASIYIVSLCFDVVECTAAISFTTDPESQGKSVSCRFAEVGSIVVRRYHEVGQDRITLGDFTGIAVSPIDEHRVRYSLDTGDAAVSFEAALVSDLSRVEARST